MPAGFVFSLLIYVLLSFRNKNFPRSKTLG